jgi:UDP-N-acetylmuramoylalanine--D-glutamate ligase
MHNVENVMAAGLMAYLAGAPLDGIGQAVATFPGVEHRIEFVRTLNGVEYYNDSKATNVDATLKAIDAFPGHLWIILGGKDKGSDYRPLREPLRRKAKAALLIGKAAEKIGGELEGAVPLASCGAMAEAVSHARAHAESGERNLWRVPAPVVRAFAPQQHDKGEDRPPELFDDEVPVGYVKFDFGDC